MYRDGLSIIKYDGKYKIEVGLVSYNETNIRVIRIEIDKFTQYQLSSCARLQGYYICSAKDGYKIVKPSFVFIHVYSSKDRSWRVFSWGCAFRANSSFTTSGNSLFYVSERTVIRINIGNGSQEQEYDVKDQ